MFFLVGFMASGKTTVGSQLAAAMELEFCDLDCRFEEITTLTIPAFFEKYGEEAFRDKESEILRDVVNECSKRVFGTGGGCVIREENRALLDRQHVIYLKVPFEVIYKRLTAKNKSARPLANTKSKEELRALYKEREKWYRSVSTYCIECEDYLPSEIVALILNLLDH
ncbi:shikimate kinase [Vagococcus fessus]|uniref:Shikimate kinase n=1 Tax=Vagococcus fessus TaxID=120370 RepID=A0A430AC98_9ENTE|nr:shikimate kinase [Vagococcus fessus]RSU04836.1 hypothetical protein CBF31_02115 [Vagococcus fessus]